MVGIKKKLCKGRTPLKLVLSLALLLACFVPVQLCSAATQVSQFGITWTFNGDYQVGQFANGDYWVIGPVTIVGISPPSSTSGRAMNGAMINPSPGSGTTQGYDSETYDQYGPAYSSSLNVADGVSSSNPLVVQNGSSLVSTISILAISRPQLQAAAILTVLSSPPPAGSFRPPYSGSDKSIKYNKSQLDFSKLSTLTPVGNTPSLATIERYFERPWIEHVPDWMARYTHPSGNMPDYGREIGTQIGEAALMLQLNFSDAQKETLAIRYIQYGIDLYGVIQDGGGNNWVPNGGHAGGRKWPVVFAGLMLDDSDMANIGAGGVGNPHFGEDSQTFYVSQTDVSSGKYLSSDIGLPEWGIRHATTPSMDDKSWSASYRRCCTANSWAGIVLSARIMGAQDLWNHDSLFDYMDRYMAIETPGDYFRQQSKFAETMWDTYRANYGPIWPDTDGGTSNQSPIANAGSDQTINVQGDGDTQVLVDLDGSASADPDGSITNYTWREGVNSIGTGATPTVSLTAGVHTITLTVTDNDGANGTDTVIVTIESQGEDTTPPIATSVAASVNTVEVFFNEALNSVYAEDISNYEINKGIIITSATLSITGNRVLLETSEHQEYEEYVITVSNVQDITGNAIAVTDLQYIYSNGLTGHWTFEEGTGEIALDISGLGNDGLLLNGTTWTETNEVAFDGVDDAVEILTLGWIPDTGTIATWVTPQEIAGIKYIFGHTVGTWSDRIQLYTTDGSLNLGLGDSHTVQLNIAQLEVETKYHIALTWDTGSYAVYIDGTEISNGTYTGLSEINTSADLGNTGNPSFRSEAFQGTIGETKTWSRALSADEVAQLLVEPEPEPDPIPEYYVGFWNFDEGEGSTAADASASGNDGTLINDPLWNVEGGIQFDGADDAVEVPTNEWDANAGTIALWVQPDTFAGTQYLFGHTVGTWGSRIQLYLEDGSLSLGLGDSHAKELGIDTLTTGTRQHVALTWDGTNYAVYVDAEQKTIGTYTGLNELSSFADIGNNGNTLFRDQAFSGIIDEAKVCNVALNAEEIVDLITDGPEEPVFGPEELKQITINWLTGDTVADIAPAPDGDGIVNMEDFSEIARKWLETQPQE